MELPLEVMRKHQRIDLSASVAEAEAQRGVLERLKGCRKAKGLYATEERLSPSQKMVATTLLHEFYSVYRADSQKQ